MKLTNKEKQELRRPNIIKYNWLEEKFEIDFPHSSAYWFNAFCRTILPTMLWIAIILALVAMCSDPTHANGRMYDGDGGDGINWLGWCIFIGIIYLMSNDSK